MQAVVERVNCNHEYIKDVQFNGMQMEGLIDTGCSVCLIRASKAVKCGILITPAEQPLFVVSGMNKPGTTTIGKWHVAVARLLLMVSLVKDMTFWW